MGGGSVVAASVIAASLDLDFNLVIVDLRGMDDVLQVFGRARRQRRAQDGRLLPSGSPDERAPAPMLLLAPELHPVTDGGWLAHLLGEGGARVVGNAARAWRTAWLLDQAGEIRYGQERALIEAADDPEAVPTPEPLKGADDEAQARSVAKRGLAWQTQQPALRAQTGYVGSGLPDKEDVVATRVDEVDAVEIILVEDVAGTMRPLDASADNWSGGRIRIPSRRFGDRGVAIAKELAAKVGLPRGSLIVPLSRRGNVWEHDGSLTDRAHVDPRWGLCWGEAAL